jgi:hypothetical protein
MTRRVCAPGARWATEQFDGIDFGDRRLSKELLRSQPLWRIPRIVRCPSSAKTGVI